jgi:hypothetical protein
VALDARECKNHAELRACERERIALGALSELISKLAATMDGGRGIQLLDLIRRRIHRLAWNYQIGFGILEWDDIRMNCPHCGQFGIGEPGPNPVDGLSGQELDDIIG